MERKSIHKSMLFFGSSTETGCQYLFRPLIIFVWCSAANLLNMMFIIIVTNKTLISAILICIIIWVHVSPASPVFISDSKIINFPWSLLTILSSQFGHRGYSIKCHIFYPLRHFTNCSTSQISINIRLASELTAELKIFVCSETVVFQHASPICINHLFT